MFCVHPIGKTVNGKPTNRAHICGFLQVVGYAALLLQIAPLQLRGVPQLAAAGRAKAV